MLKDGSCLGESYYERWYVISMFLFQLVGFQNLNYTSIFAEVVQISNFAEPYLLV